MIYELAWADNVIFLCHRDIGVFTYIKSGLQLHAWDHGLPAWILTCKRSYIRACRIRNFATSSYRFLLQFPDHRLTKDGHIQNELLFNGDFQTYRAGSMRGTGTLEHAIKSLLGIWYSARCVPGVPRRPRTATRTPVLSRDCGFRIRDFAKL